MPPSRPPVSHGYTRVSSEKQAKHGVSMEAQPDIIRRYCSWKELPEPLIYEDPAEKGPTPFADRPAGAAILEAIRPGDHVIFTKMDRGFRNLADLLHWFEAWQQTGVNLHIIDFAGFSIDQKSNNGRLIFHFFAAIAEWERGQISERCLAVTRYLRSQGMWASPRVPIGFKAKKNPHGKGYYAVPDPVYRNVMGKIYEWVTIDRRSFYDIFQHLRVSKATIPGRTLWRGQKREWNEQWVYMLYKAEVKLREAEAKQPEGETGRNAGGASATFATPGSSG